MPLTMCKSGEKVIISKVLGNTSCKGHLNDLGFTEGSEITIVNELAGNLIVNIKDSRVALDKKLASKILVE